MRGTPVASLGLVPPENQPLVVYAPARGGDRMIKRTLSGFRAAASERMKRLNVDPDFAAAKREGMKRLRTNPAIAAKRTAASPATGSHRPRSRS
jgi:hypothetical protein